MGIYDDHHIHKTSQEFIFFRHQMSTICYFYLPMKFLNSAVIYCPYLDDVWGSTSFGLNNRVRVTQLSEPAAFYRLFIIWCQLYQFFSSTSHHASESELCQTVSRNYSRSTSQETSTMVQIYMLDSHLFQGPKGALNKPLVTLFRTSCPQTILASSLYTIPDRSLGSNVLQHKLKFRSK